MPIDPKKVQWDETPDVTVTKIGGKPIGQSADIDPAQVQWDPMPRGSVGAEAPRTRTWMQTGREALSNVGESGARFLGGVYETVTKPVETLEQLGEVLTGAYARFIPQEWLARPDKAQEFIQKANAANKSDRVTGFSAGKVWSTIRFSPLMRPRPYTPKRD